MVKKRYLRAVLLVFLLALVLGCSSCLLDEEPVEMPIEESPEPQPEILYYTVTWRNDNGVELKSERVAEGTLPAFGKTPEKEATKEFTYTFAGWSPEVVPASEDVVYTATYTEKKNSYRLVFSVNDETYGSVDLAELTLPYGTKYAVKENKIIFDGVTVTATPAVDADPFFFTFAGWSIPEGNHVLLGEENFVANFSKTKKDPLTLTFLTGDKMLGGVNVESLLVDAGSEMTVSGDTILVGNVTVRAVPREMIPENLFLFIGWSLPEGKYTVTENITVTAIFARKLRLYTVTWENYDGSVLKTDSLPYGETPDYQGALPVKNEEYEFEEWSPAISPVEGNVIYVATFSKKQEKGPGGMNIGDWDEVD